MGQSVPLGLSVHYGLAVGRGKWKCSSFRPSVPAVFADHVRVTDDESINIALVFNSITLLKVHWCTCVVIRWAHDIKSLIQCSQYSTALLLMCCSVLTYNEHGRSIFGAAQYGSGAQTSDWLEWRRGCLSANAIHLFRPTLQQYQDRQDLGIRSSIIKISTNRCFAACGPYMRPPQVCKALLVPGCYLASVQLLEPHSRR